MVTLNNPLAATYEVYVDLFAVGGGTATVPLNSWVVPDAAAGNLTVSPASRPVSTGPPRTLALTGSGLDGRRALPRNRRVQRWYEHARSHRRAVRRLT